MPLLASKEIQRRPLYNHTARSCLSLKSCNKKVFLQMGMWQNLKQLDLRAHTMDFNGKRNGTGRLWAERRTDIAIEMETSAAMRETEENRRRVTAWWGDQAF